MLELRPLNSNDEAQFWQAMEAYRRTPEFVFFFSFEPQMTFQDYLVRLSDYARGANLPAGHVPSRMYFGFVDGRLVGRLMIRQRLNDFLLRLGGHIGYATLVDERRQGYARAMLQLALPIARKWGIERALLTCDDDNYASIRVIETCGGRLEDVVENGAGRVPKRRYWIDLTT